MRKGIDECGSREFERREEIFNRLIQEEGTHLQDMGLTDDEIQDKITEMVDIELKQVLNNK